MDWKDITRGGNATGRFLFAADTHFDAEGAWLGRGVVGDAEHAFKLLVDHAVNAQAAVILGGDIVNRPDAHPASIGPVFRQLDRLASAGLPLYYVLGQHDGRKDWLSAHGWPTHVHNRAFTIGNVGFVGLDFRQPDEYRELLATIPEDMPCLVTHQVWAELLGVGRDRDTMRLEEVPASVGFVFTGDYHKTVVKTVKRPDAGPLVAYSPGSMAMQALDEPSEKCYFLGNAGGRQVMPVAYPTRPFLRLATHDEAAIAAAADTARVAAERMLSPALARPIVVLPHAGTSEERRLRRALSDRAHVFFDPAPRAEADGLREQAAAIRQAGLADVLKAVLPPGSAEYNLALALLDSPDPAAELAARRSRFLEGAAQAPAP